LTRQKAQGRRQKKILPALAVFAVLLLTYGYFIRTARDENSNSRLSLIFAVTREGRLTIDSFHQDPWLHTIDKAYYGGHYYSDKAPGTAVLGVLAYAPIYHGARALGIDTDSWSMFSRTKYLITVIVAGLPSALAGTILYVFLIRITGDGWRSYLATIAVALGTMVLPFSTLLFGHALAAGCLIVAFLMAASWRRSTRPARKVYFAGLGFLLGFAILTEFTAALGAVPILLYVFVSRAGDPRRHLSASSAAALATGFAIPLALYITYSLACFGSPLSTGYTYEADAAFRATHAVGVVGVSRPRLEVLYYLTFHPIRGIFLQSPILLVSLAGLYDMAKHREWRLEALVVGAIVAAFFSLNAGFGWWWAGWTFGPRLLIPMLWFLALPLVFVSPRLMPVLSILILVSTIQMLIPVAGNPLVSDAAAVNINRFGIHRVTGPSPIYQQCLPILQRGEYTDNLGRRAGLQHAASLLPLVAAWVAVTVIARRSPRRFEPS
jgi:4-amino-4-deoxy-L-arabinose transferase-like glycosyltransferase